MFALFFVCGRMCEFILPFFYLVRLFGCDGRITAIILFFLIWVKSEWCVLFWYLGSYALFRWGIRIFVV